MNISTYEARIKALEDQLNPPVPPVDPRTGIQSIVITPDVGGSNSRLAAIMPIAPVTFDPMDDPISFSNPNNDVDPETEYVITATPGTEYYCFIQDVESGDTVQSSNAGEPISMTFSGKNNIEAYVTALAVGSLPDPSNPPDVWCNVHLLIGYIQ